MEAVPRVHRHRHNRRSNSRRHQERNSSELMAEPTSATAAGTVITTTTTPVATSDSHSHATAITTTNIVAAEEGLAGRSSSSTGAALLTAARTRLMQENERQNTSEAAMDDIEMECSVSQQTVLLVNGHSLQDPDTDEEPEAKPNHELKRQAAQTRDEDKDEDEEQLKEQNEAASNSPTEPGGSKSKESLQADDAVKRSESPQPTANGDSSRNSSGDALSLRETLQQLQPTLTNHSSSLMSGVHHHHHHQQQQQRRRTSPSPGRRSRLDEPDPTTSYFHRGIIGFMDREIKTTTSGSALGSPSPTPSGATKKLQSLSDPQASPAQRSTRSRSSLEKSPRRKRSKSESRRRRERKLIAAGEMEVRQANETLMRYLKQCTDMNDASLSGELEINQNLDERRVHRKTKSERDKRGHIMSKLYTAGGLSSILKELSDDIVPADGEEIYNPFTPVVSPTDDIPAHMDKMFIQTSSGYRPVDHCYYKHSFVGANRFGVAGGSSGAASGGGCGGGGVSGAVFEHGSRASLVGIRGSQSFGESRCLLDAQCRSSEIFSNLHLACVVQRIWLLLANICHGLLAGLALAHLLFVVSSHPTDWSQIISDISLAEQQQQRQQLQLQPHQLQSPSSPLEPQLQTEPKLQQTSNEQPGYETDSAVAGTAQQSWVVIADYAAFAEIYANTFYCLAIVCLVSIFDRMDVCSLDLSNATELVSFRWIIIAMIYIATIILSICSNSIDQKLYFNNAANVTVTQQEMLSTQVFNVWNSLSVARSLGAVCGWLLIGLTPQEDLLYEHLLDMASQTNG